MSVDRTRLLDELERDEGFRPSLYLDSKGVPTIGIGHNLRMPITKAAAYYICHDDLDKVEAEMDSHISWWRKLDETRQRVLFNMCFNLGIAKLMEFEHTLAYAMIGDYASAAREMLASDWAKQVGPRALRLADMMAKGDDHVAVAS